MKKIFSMLLILMIIFSLTITTFAVDFKDVNENHAQYEAIETLGTLNIIYGYDKNTYGADDILTRAQLCTMLVRAIYKDDIHYSATNTFVDVDINHWAKVYIDTAYTNKLMNGYGSGVFGPEDKLTYTQAARVILNALGYGTLQWPIGVNTVAYELGLYDNVSVVDFEASCTRAHAAQMIYNAFDLELVKEYAGQHFGIDKYFLNDVLGFEKTTKYIDGHLYEAYKNLTDKKAKLLVTNIRSTYEKVIYPWSIDSYKFVNSNRAEKYSFDWSKVDLFVNGVDVNDPNWFVNAESAIGIFDNEENLIAVYVSNEGVDYMPGTNIPDTITNKIKNDKNFDSRISTVTYFTEDCTYIISNKFVCGFVTDVSNKVFWIDNIKYSFDKRHDVEMNDFIVIYYNYNDEIVGYAKIANPYYFNVKTMTYHTWECEHYNDRANDTNWFNSEDTVIQYFVNKETIVRFNGCEDCHAEGRYVVSITNN